jgi:hypothetical protein
VFLKFFEKTLHKNCGEQHHFDLTPALATPSSQHYMQYRKSISSQTKIKAFKK